MLTKKRIVLGVIGNDTHVVANRILYLGLNEAGFFVCNLGTNNTPDDFVEAACEVSADAVLVSSINGEGEYWCVNFREHFHKAGIDKILLYIGGNLVVGERDSSEVINLFESYGFDRVFYQTRSISNAVEILSKDLL
tara:strand:+ start:72 stop:482 length:411 start_codon:yes stop_codon:yes gene_type:complete